jgi:hypothetical protein
MEWTHPHFDGVTWCARMKVCRILSYPRGDGPLNKITTLGIDLAKAVFQLHGVDFDPKYPGPERASAVEPAETFPHRDMNLLEEIPSLLGLCLVCTGKTAERRAIGCRRFLISLIRPGGLSGLIFPRHSGTLVTISNYL